MISITEKTLQDLQFPTVLETISGSCNTDIGKQKALEIVPFKDKASLMPALWETSEYVSSFQNNNAIPNHGFDSIAYEIKFLAIEDSFLEAGSFRKIAAISETANTLLAYFRKFDDYYPNLNLKASQVQLTKEIVQKIDEVVDKYGEIKDNASPELLHIRREMNIIRGKVNQSFGMALTQYNQLGYLDDIKESFVQNRRVLAVLAMYRRKVKGSIMGSSKTGSIAYIEPEATLRYSRELGNLEYEEKEEIMRILKQLSDAIRIFLPLIIQYQDFLSDIDVIAAKAKYAVRINGILPNITEERRLNFRDAYHPILYLNNKQKNGIPFGLINRAKKKIEVGKVRFDKTIATLQKERSKMEKTSQTLKEEETKAREEGKKMESINIKIKQKLESYQELYDSNQRIIYMGQKIDDIAEKYFNSKNKKELMGEFLKIVEIENSKRKKAASVKEEKAKTEKKKEIIKEVAVQVSAIRQEKKEKKIKAAQVIEKPKPVLKVGDRVRMFDGKAVGSIDTIEKNKATVNYGVFTSKVSLDVLELVEAKR